MGITVGCHRLWSHRSFKARLLLRIFLMILATGLHQEDIYKWVRNHRTHHKYSDTDGDPHNPSRGLFFAHMGWIMTRKHPEAFARSKNINMDDILDDPVVQFQRKFYKPLALIFTILAPSLIPY